MATRLGRPTVEIVLSGDERKTLERWARRHSSSQALSLRCRIVLACADSERGRQGIADEVGCSPATVTKWRRRFAEGRLDGLADAPRPGAARTIGDDVVEAVVIDALETAPTDASHWSTRSLAAKHGISRQTVSDRADIADAANHTRQSNARLSTQRHDRPIRRVEHRDRNSAHRTPPEPHLRTVHQVLEQDQPGRPGRLGRACHLGQPVHPQNPRPCTNGCSVITGSTSISRRPTQSTHPN